MLCVITSKAVLRLYSGQCNERQVLTRTVRPKFDYENNALSSDDPPPRISAFEC